MPRTKRRGGWLMEAVNVRYVRPHVCAFCAHFVTNEDGDEWRCRRVSGPHGDMVDGDQYLTNCGRYKPDLTIDELLKAKEAMRAKH